MKRSKFSETQIAYALGQVEAGTPVGDVCRQLELRVVGYHHPVPAGRSAKWIREITRILRRRHASDAMHQRTRERWNSLLEYNAHDCIGLSQLVLAAARGYEKQRLGRAACPA